MKILVTGHCGRIGPAIVGQLQAAGHAVCGFDLAEGGDILDAEAMARAAEGAECIVHLAGLADDRGRPPAEVFEVNLTGTANALLAAERAGVRRFVNMSSGKALGMLEYMPHYLPMDDAHPATATRPYGLAKRLGEDMCEAFTQRIGMETISLRAVAVFDDEGYAAMIEGPPKPANPGNAWHMGVHIHTLDLAEATAAAVVAPLERAERVLIAAEDIAAAAPTRDLVRQFAAEVEWRGDDALYDADPHRGLVDLSHAARVMDWRPARRWPGRA